MKKYTIIACFFLNIAFLSGCAKIPKKSVSPSVKIDMTIKNNKEIYMVNFTAGIQNQNSDIALTHCKGTVVLHDASKKEGKSFIIPFSIPVIMPFETGIIEHRKAYSQKEIEPLISILGMSIEKVIEDKGIEGTYIKDDTISLNLQTYEKEQIGVLLKDKINENNK